MGDPENKKYISTQNVGADLVSAHGITLITLIITIIILLILAGVTINLTLGDNGLFNISKIMEKNKLAETEEEKEEPILSYKLYDNTGEKLQVLAIIKKEEGIQSIEYTDENGKDVLLHCNNKQKVGIDIKAETNKDYTFKIVSNDVEYIETFNIPEDYIENYFSEPKLNDESTEKTYSVEYYTDLDESEGVTYYYKLGKNSTTWIKYTGNIIVYYSDIDDTNTLTTTLTTKQVSSSGDTILGKDYVIKAQTLIFSNYDVFGDFLVSNNTLAAKGISVVSYTNAESSKFAAYHLGVGHSSDRANFSATYKIDMSTLKNNLTLNLITVKQLYINYNLYADYGRTYPSYIGASATIYYTDGTTTSQSIPNKTYDSYTSVPMTFNIEQNKEIDYVLMTISGLDNYTTGAYGYINSIIFKNAVFESAEK